ncbi:MAG: sigma-70 family RNA polymerase sigma factor [Agathobacter sp.]|nr:sigma-70 family RNA polymerase sigma factor [Agathobacter sp.]
MAISEQLLDGINTLQIGNSCGFDVIYNETSSYVYARARMIMKDEQDANDLVQDTYIQAYQNINSLQDPQNIFAWLGGIAYRQGMKIYRKKNDVLLDEDCEGFFEQIESEDISWSPELSAEQKAVGNIVAEIIDELPPLQKAALTAFYYDGIKIDEIAQMYDCSSNTIKSRLNYAKKFVREKVETREKQDNVRLHSVGGVSIFFLGIHQLLSLPKYTVSQAISGQILSTVYESLKIDNKNLASKKFSAKSFSVAKTALIVGSATVGTLTIVATSVAAYNHVSPSKADIISTPAAVVIDSEAQITFEVPEVPEATEVTETTEVTEATETTETTEASEATEATEKTKKEEASEDSKKSDSKDTSDKKKKPKEENTSSDNPLEGSSISIDATAE